MIAAPARRHAAALLALLGLLAVALVLAPGASAVPQGPCDTCPGPGDPGPVLTAAFTSSPAAPVTNQNVNFNAGDSTADDGSQITGYAWDFGDGATDNTNTATPSHSYAAGGTYTVTLTVTDNRGGMATSTQPVTVTAPITGISFVGSDTKSANAMSWTVQVPAGFLSGDGLVLVVSNAGTTPVSAPTGLTGWSALQTITTASSVNTVYQRVAASGDAGQAVTLSWSGGANIHGNVSLLAYRGTNTTSPVSTFAAVNETVSRTTHTTPTATVPSGGSWALSIWTDKSSATTTITPPGDLTQRTYQGDTGSGRISVLTADNNAPLANGTVVGGELATADAASAVDTMWTLVLSR